MCERDPAKASAHDKHPGDEQDAVPGPPELSIRVAGGFTPAVCGQQTACGCGRKNVVIEFEASDAEECKDDDRPQPEQPFTDRDRLVPATPLERIDASAGGNGAPRKECSSEGTDVERVIDGARGELNRLRDVPQVAGE